jgi:hypothetical protein
VQAACNLMEETINQLDNVSHERDRLRIEVGFSSRSYCHSNNVFLTVYLNKTIPIYCR